MRSIWKGSLVFGLVNVPVAVYSATEDKDVRFHQLHAADLGRIRYQRTCEVCGKQIAYGDIVKGYENEDGKVAVLTDDDFAALPSTSEKEIQLLSFVPSEQIDPVMYGASYVLEPTSKSPKAYVLLRETLAETERTAIVHFALRQKTRLAALRVRGDLLMVQTLLWPDEVREFDFPSLAVSITVSAAEKQMAALLVGTYSDDFHPEEHEDSYRAELQQLIDAKLGGAEPQRAADDSGGEDAEVLDLLAALERSVNRANGADRHGSGGTRASLARTGVPNGHASDEATGKSTAKSGIARKAPKKAAAAPVKATKKSPTKTAAATDIATEDEPATAKEKAVSGRRRPA